MSNKDYRRIYLYPWYIKKGRNTFYAFTLIDGRETRMHRLILGMMDSKRQVDHKDGNGLNNQRSNLRTCTNGDNGRNRQGYGKIPHKGVGFEKGRYRARLLVNGKKKYFGYFNSAKDAAKAINDVIFRLKNPFYRLNKTD